MLIKTVDLIKYQLQGVQLLLWAIQLNETVKERYYSRFCFHETVKENYISRFCFHKTVKENIWFQESVAEDRKPHLETRRTEEWNNKGDQNKSSSSLNLIRWPQKIIIGIILTEFDQVTYFFEAETELLCTPNYALFPFNTHSCQVAVSPSNMVLFVDNIWQYCSQATAGRLIRRGLIISDFMVAIICRWAAGPRARRSCSSWQTRRWRVRWCWSHFLLLYPFPWPCKLETNITICKCWS